MENSKYLHLIGVPYSKLDCWGLCQKFYKDVFGITLSNFEGAVPLEKWEQRSLIHTNKGEFVETKSPSFGDLVVISLHGFECHLGIVVDEKLGLFLHTLQGAGSVVDRIGRWNNLISGYYTIEK